MKVIGFDSESIIKFILAFSLGAIIACNGSGNADNSNGSTSGPTMAQFTELQNRVVALEATSASLQAQVNGFNSSITALQTDDSAFQSKLAGDETTLSKITLLGHQPRTSSVTGRRINSLGQTSSGRTQAISYGPCSDMGVLVGNSQPDSMTTAVEDFKQCTGYEYGAAVETGAIAKPIALWFDGANCTGNMFEAENDGAYNRQVLQDGVVFVSPVDGVTELMVVAGQTGQTTVLLSNFSGGTCNSGAIETQTAYHVTTNDLSVTGVPSAVPANFIL